MLRTKFTKHNFCMKNYFNKVLATPGVGVLEAVLCECGGPGSHIDDLRAVAVAAAQTARRGLQSTMQLRLTLTKEAR